MTDGGRVSGARLRWLLDSTIPNRYWTFLSIACALGAGFASVAGLHYTAELRLTGDRTMLATTAIAALAGAAAVSALGALLHEMIGLLGLAFVCAGVSTFWLLLGPNRFAGPVVLTVGEERGVHLTDPLAAIPLALAGVLLARAVRLARHPDCSSV